MTFRKKKSCCRIVRAIFVRAAEPFLPVLWTGPVSWEPVTGRAPPAARPAGNLTANASGSGSRPS